MRFLIREGKARIVQYQHVMLVTRCSYRNNTGPRCSSHTGKTYISLTPHYYVIPMYDLLADRVLFALTERLGIGLLLRLPFPSLFTLAKS